MIWSASGGSGSGALFRVCARTYSRGSSGGATFGVSLDDLEREWRVWLEGD